jgi:hypothetical protein
MTNQHRATPEQWADIERWGATDHHANASGTLELRARVEALEAAQRLRFIEIVTSGESDEEHQRLMKQLDQPGHFHRLQPSPPAPADSLVERVINAIAYEHDISRSWKKEARAAIREVARWFAETRDSPETAAVLNDEANK